MPSCSDYRGSRDQQWAIMSRQSMLNKHDCRACLDDCRACSPFEREQLVVVVVSLSNGIDVEKGDLPLVLADPRQPQRGPHVHEVGHRVPQVVDVVV